MADPYYGPGGTGYYTDPATGKRYYQVRYQQGPDGYDPNASAQDSRLTYDPNGGPTYGAGATNPSTGSGGTNSGTAPTGQMQDGYNGTAAGVPTTGSQSARATIQSLLDSYGLGSLTDWYWSKVVAGEPDAQIMLELYQTPEFKTRYPAYADLQAKGRAISLDQYRQIETQYVQLFRQSGLPEGFYDSPDDFAKFIANEVSPQEMSGRLDLARKAVYETPPEVRAELARLYGLNVGDVMAYMLDPTKAQPLIEQQFTAASAGAAARLSGFGLLTTGEAERVGLSGESFDQLSRGFDTLARSQELMSGIIGETDQSQISRQEQLDAAFGGNTAAQRRLARRAEQRIAAFAGGGGFASDREGVSGLGSAAS